jgi:hypothetical protein
MLAANSGAVGRNRTGDLFVTSELLYQLSYNGDDAYSIKEMPAKARKNCVEAKVQIGQQNRLPA